MQGLFMRLAPFTQDSSGAATVFGDCPAMVMPLDMNGTVNMFCNRVNVADESPFKMVAALDVREANYVLGKQEDFVRQIARNAEEFGGEFLVLLHGPVSAMMGMDLQGLAAQASERLGRRVLAVECTTSALHDEGILKALMAVYAQVKEAAEPPVACQTAGVNILGLNAIDHHEHALRDLLVDGICRASGLEPVSFWGCHGGWDEWGRAHTAQENIVVTASALKLAQTMQRDWGIPYRRIDELDWGVTDNIEPLPNAQNLNVLVVHEQLMANMARNVLEAFGCQVTVASFHKMQREAKRKGDIRLKSERQLVDLLAGGGFDVFVGDESLLSCAPWEPSPAFIGLPHSAVAVDVGAKPQWPTPFSGEWTSWARCALEDAIANANGWQTR